MIDEHIVTLSEWLIHFLENNVKPIFKPSTYAHFADNCFKHIMPLLGQKELRKITTAEIQQFFNFKATAGSLKGGPLSPKSVKNMRVIFNLAMKQAVIEGHIRENPVPMTAIKRVRTKRVEALADEDLAILEAYLYSLASSISRAELFNMHLGIRRGETCSLRFGNYNATKGTIHIEETVKRLPNHDAQPGDCKTKLVFNAVKSDSSDRILTLPFFLRDIIDEQRSLFVEQFGRLPSANDFIFFSTKGTLIDPDDLTHFHNDVLKKLGLEHKKLHALRHTFATRGIENGIDVSTMSGILGHADVTTTVHFYVRPRDAAMEKAMLGIRPVSTQTNSQVCKTVELTK
jgi:integrase